MMCNGLFTSNRTLEQIFDQELAFFREPIGTAEGGDYNVDWNRRAVEIGTPGAVPVMRAVFREGIGCIILPPDQTLADIDELPELTLPYPHCTMSAGGNSRSYGRDDTDGGSADRRPGGIIRRDERGGRAGSNLAIGPVLRGKAQGTDRAPLPL